MNTNSFASSLRDGYGQPADPAMLIALGLSDDPEATALVAQHIVSLTSHCRPAVNRGTQAIGMPANENSPRAEPASS